GAGSPNQNTLDSIADNLTRDTARPAHSRSVKSSALPPIRIPPGCMHGRLEAAGQRLADLVSGHKQAFAMLGRREHEILAALGTVCSTGDDPQLSAGFSPPSALAASLPSYARIWAMKSSSSSSLKSFRRESVN